jgi:N-succinyldiaminopimelate aminotransferase
LGLDGVTASKRLLELGKIAATPMTHWGSVNCGKYVRFVFSNEPVHRLRGVGNRAKHALT